MDLLAHGIGGRSDLPVPFWMALYGAGIAVVLSFAALGALWPVSRLRGDKGRPLPAGVERAVTVLRWVLRVAVLVAWLVLLAAGFAGEPTNQGNPLPWFVYIVLWVGLVPVSLLFGPVWRAVNPLRTVHELWNRAVGGDPERGLSGWPDRLGYWPAALFLGLFTWVELVLPTRADPRLLAFLVFSYSAVQLGLAANYGSRWFARGEAFEVYSTLIGRLAPLGRRPDGRLVLRNPLDGLAGQEREPGLVAVIVVLLGSTAYDGVTRAGWWRSIAGNDTGWGSVPLATLALLTCFAIVAVTYVLATRRSGAPAGADPDPLPGAFAHSVVPIAIGYAVAHYFSLLMYEGQQAWILASDPFGTGANWFGTADWSIDYTLFATGTIALVQIGAIVVGHVVGVIAAHDRAVELFKGRAALRGQYPLLAVMVAYTLAGVALVVGT